jgi:hypothetical protein
MAELTHEITKRLFSLTEEHFCKALDDVVKIHVKRCGLTQMSMEEIDEHLKKLYHIMKNSKGDNQ